MYKFGNAEKNKLGLKESMNKYSLDNFNYDINEKNDSHAIIAREIIKFKKNIDVLDIGCGSGIIGGYLKDYDNINIDGVEIDKEAIKEVEKNDYYRKVYDLSIYDLIDKNIQLGQYDVIIFADLLEHLVNPYDILFKIKKYLKKDGIILVSIPNIAHVDIIKNLINNNFNYNVVGTLDTTHLRFFTKKSFVEMIDNINKNTKDKYEVYYISSTYTYTEEKYNDSLFSYYINENDDKYILQNIFKLMVVEDNIELNSITGLLNEKTNQFEKLENSLRLLKNSNSDLISEKNSLNIKIDSLNNEKKTLETQIIELNTIINELTKEQDKLLNNINVQNNEINNLKAEKENILKSNQDLHQKIKIEYKNSKKLNRINSKLLSENIDLINKYNLIINSKRWKTIDKIGNLKNRIIRKNVK